MIDIIMPSQKELSNFLSMAETLQLQGLCILAEQPMPLPSNSSLLLNHACSRRTSSPVCIARNPAEISKQTDILFDVEPIGHRDAARSRNSGLTPELLASLKQKNIALGFSLHHLFQAEKPEQHFGRIAQNFKLARKAKIPIIVASLATTPMEMRAEKDIRSLFTLLGLHCDETKKAVSALQDIIQRNTAAGSKAQQGVDIRKV